MPPFWLQILAVIHVILSMLAALLVTGDIFMNGRRQKMAIMDAVWPLTTLYWGPLGLVFYLWFGRAAAMGREAPAVHSRGETPMWQATFKGATHCGAGCALGDFVGEWLAFATGFALFGSVFAGKLVLAFLLAYLAGIVFQYFSVVPMRHLGFGQGVVAALKIDTLSIAAYEIGMFVVMGLTALVLPDLAPTTWTYWFMMQIAMVLGFATTYPVNWWLIRRGTKEKM
jgi:hypothetical protein